MTEIGRYRLWMSPHTHWYERKRLLMDDISTWRYGQHYESVIAAYLVVAFQTQQQKAPISGLEPFLELLSVLPTIVAVPGEERGSLLPAFIDRLFSPPAVEGWDRIAEMPQGNQWSDLVHAVDSAGLRPGRPFAILAQNVGLMFSRGIFPDLKAWALLEAAPPPCERPVIREEVFSWNDSFVPRFLAHPDYQALPILADALEEAGCDSQPILDHLRLPAHQHTVSCWALRHLTRCLNKLEPVEVV